MDTPLPILPKSRRGRQGKLADPSNSLPQEIPEFLGIGLPTSLSVPPLLLRHGTVLDSRISPP